MSRFRRWSYFSQFDAHPIESVAEDYIDRASRVNEYSADFQISYDEIYDERIAVRFQSLSTFTASELGLLFSQLFLFVPIEDFLLFCHWFVERRAFLSELASGPPHQYRWRHR
ncbi:hypothetical protein F2Q69_00029491 [Brassica cretica]|uniref:Uncharacterized protein n=1 Tax=Brassica cretica TaxID=69181 RepID=A0A8S9RRG1_BRACR|nr:hypothetical protein F2Q69_00029491 [Brassica cretica]